MSAEVSSQQMIANIDVFARTVAGIARENEHVVVVTSDSRGSGRLTDFAREFPSRMVETGIAEQNLVGVASGLAGAGKSVFAVSPACFLTARSFEQVKNDVCYSNMPVILVGISAGVSYGALGTTHHSLNDFAALRGVNNISIISPADAWETREAVLAACRRTTPVYIRIGKKPVPELPIAGDERFEIGKGRVLRSGHDISLIATGELVWRAMAAADRLDSARVSATVVSMHTVKPLDETLLCRVARETGAVLTLEEHSIHGGLADACASSLLRDGVATRFGTLAIPDEETVVGSQDDILSHYGMSPEGIAVTARAMLEKTP